MKLSHLLYRSHLDEGEKILAVVHRHWLIAKKKIWKPSTFGIIPSILVFVFFRDLWLISLIWFVIGLCVYILKMLEWYFDCLVITTSGILDIERRGIFDNTAKRIEYHMIDGVSYTIQGFLPTLLNYGDIVVDKLGGGMQINLHDAPNPKKIERMIMKYQEKFVKEKSFSDHETLKGMLAEMITTHIKQNGIIPVVKKKNK